MDSLSEIYSSLSEDDMWAGLWTERAQFPDTALAIVYESQGLFEQAQETYEQVCWEVCAITMTLRSRKSNQILHY